MVDKKNMLEKDLKKDATSFQTSLSRSERDGNRISESDIRKQGEGTVRRPLLKAGFSLAEVLVAMLIMSVFYVATAKVLTSKQHPLEQVNHHGYYECYFNNGELIEHRVDMGKATIPARPVDKCEFNPPTGRPMFNVYIAIPQPADSFAASPNVNVVNDEYETSRNRVVAQDADGCYYDLDANSQTYNKRTTDRIVQYIFAGINSFDVADITRLVNRNKELNIDCNSPGLFGLYISPEAQINDSENMAFESPRALARMYAEGNPDLENEMNSVDLPQRYLQFRDYLRNTHPQAGLTQAWGDSPTPPFPAVFIVW